MMKSPTSKAGPPPAAADLAPHAAAAGMLPRKTFECEFKDDGDEGGFVLYAAAFGNVDRGGDVIERGAFDNLAEFVKDGWIALNHDNRSLPIGYPTAAVQDEHGLKITGKFHSTPGAQAVRTVMRERMAAGKAVKCSLGYLTRKESFEARDGRTVRRIERLSIYEASIVNLPMNPAAETIDAKGTTMPENPKPPAPETKAGRAISAANRDTLRALGERLGEHHSELAEQLKCMKKSYKGMRETRKALDDFVKSFEPANGEDDEDDGEDEGDEGERPRERPAAKSARPAPPDRHAIAAALAAVSLPD